MPDEQKRPYTERIHSFVAIYQESLSKRFNNLAKKAEKAGEKYYEEIGQNFHPNDDPSDFAEKAMNYRDEYYQSRVLMKYNVYMMALATLYQLWEQQVRNMLFEQLTWYGNSFVHSDSGKPFEFKDFATDVNFIKELFSYSEWKITDLDVWDDINELRLVQNVIKHGEGAAAKQLRKKRPDFGVEENQSTLNEITLTIPDKEILKYRDALISFWEQMPQHVSFRIPEHVPAIQGPLKLVEDPATGEFYHEVDNHKLQSNTTIQVKFGKQKWIEGTYIWSGQAEDMAELHSKNGSDILLLRLTNQIKIQPHYS